MSGHGNATFSRRALLRGAVLAGSAALVAACGPATAPAETPTAAKPAEPAKAAEAPKPTEAPRPTAAPAAATKPAAAAPTSAPAAATAVPAASGGSQVKTLQKPRVILNVRDELLDRARDGHPWIEGLKAFGRSNPNNQPTLEILANGQGNAWWERFATMLAAGDLGDVMQGTIAGMMQNRGDIAAQVDVAATMTKEDRDDYGEGVINTVRLKPGKKDFIIGWPITLAFSQGPSFNATLLEEKGVDWVKIQSNGWSWEEYADVLTKLTDPSQGRYGIVADHDHLSFMFRKLNEDGGMADVMDGPGGMEFGNVWQFQGPVVVKTARFIFDLINKYKVTDAAHLTLSTNDEIVDLLLKGKGGSLPADFWLTINYPKTYNEQVKAGKIQGKEVTTKVAALPNPHSSDMPGTSIARGTNVCVFTQQPYKGDDHTQASLEVAKFLAGTDMQAKNAKWYGNTIPARQSAQKLAPPEDEQLVRLLDYSKKHVRWTHPYAHPTYAKWEDTVMNAGVEQLVAGKMTPEQLEEELRKGGDNLMKTWLQTEKNKEVVDYWARVPEGYPGPQFPNWKQRTHQEAGY